MAASVATLLGEPFRFTATLTREVEIVETSDAVEAFRTQQSGTLRFRGEYESPERFLVEQEDGPVLTFYDGEVYASTGGAAEPLDESDRERQGLADLPGLLEAGLEGADLEDLGVEDLDGRQVRHYSGSSDGAGVRDAYARASGFEQIPPPESAFEVEGVRTDFYIDEATGDLLRQSEQARFVFDFGEFGLGQDGVARLILSQERDFTDQGGDVVVPRP